MNIIASNGTPVNGAVRNPTIPSADDGPSTQRVDSHEVAAQVRRTLSILIAPGQRFEVRTPGARPAGRYFVNDPGGRGIADAAEHAAGLSGRYKAVYFTLNPIEPGWGKPSASDQAIVSRRLILVDCDPTRPADTSATEAERDQAWETALGAQGFLASHGWPAPLLADSGNGIHLVYLVDLPNDEAADKLVRGLLAGLSRKFGSDAVSIDTTVSNASRICKLYGTMARKGDDTPDRPHRPSKILIEPETLTVTPRDRIAATVDELASDLEAEIEQKRSRAGAADGENGFPRVDVTDRRPGAGRRAARYLDSIPPAVAGERGHSQTFKAALAVGPGFDLPRDTALHLLRTYSERCSPPWSEKELQHKVDEAYKVEPRRGWLRDADRPRPDGGTARPSSNGHRHANGSAYAAAGVETVVEEDIESIEIADRWPVRDDKMFHGIAGEIAWMIDPHSEADPVATLIQLLVATGVMIGGNPHFVVSATKHRVNLFAVIVGLSSVARKGMSWDAVEMILGRIDEEWVRSRIGSGLCTGVGLAHQVRDARYEEKDGAMVQVDPGVADKRLLVQESEASGLFKAIDGRDNYGLSENVRKAWDHVPLKALTKREPTTATGAHIGIIGHVTNADVNQYLAKVNLSNGLANRFLWTAARRSKILPDGGDLFELDWNPIVLRLQHTLLLAKDCGKMTRDRVASEIWHSVYEQLSEAKPGASGCVVNRAAPQVVRLSCLYALLDRSPVVRAPHLVAALALWDYCEQSARMTFGDGMGNPNAEKLLAALKGTPEGLTKTEICNLFGRNLKNNAIKLLLSDLLTQQVIHRRTDKAAKGRPAERWFPGRSEGVPR